MAKIQTAAEALIARRGIGSVTIDAVAAEAGISKGAVLHHFPSKSELITSVALHRLQRTVEAMNDEIALRSDRSNQSLLGIVGFAAKEYSSNNGFSRALLVAAVENSRSLGEFRSAFAGKLDAVRAECADPDAGMALFFAAMGLLVTNSLGVVDLDGATVQRVFDAIERMAQ